MSWRTVVISKRAKLEYRLGYLVVRNELGRKEIHVKEIGHLIIENTGVSLTAALVSELTKNKVKIIFCDQDRNPLAEVMPYYNSYNTSQMVMKQVDWSQDIKLRVWDEIIKEKIFNQAQVLRDYDYIQHKQLLEYRERVEEGDRDNMEAVASRQYFLRLFGAKFSRDDREDMRNIGLNYGYTILLSTINRYIVKFGNITQLGIFHRNPYNQYNLGSDLIEPLRPIVDRKVIEAKFQDFGLEEKLELVDILNQKVKIDGREHYLTNAMDIYVQSVIKALNRENLEEIRFIEF